MSDFRGGSSRGKKHSICRVGKSSRGLWFFTEFLETAGTAALERGSHEPLSDKHNRYTHVSIVELGPARIVLHWKYALSDSTEQANVFHGNTWAEEISHRLSRRTHRQEVDWISGKREQIAGTAGGLGSGGVGSGFRSGRQAERDDQSSICFARPRRQGALCPELAVAQGNDGCASETLSLATGRRMFSVPALRKQPEPFLIVPNRKDYFPRIPCGACGGDHLAALLWLDPGVYKNWPGCSGDCPRIVKGKEEDLEGSSRHTCRL